MRTLLLGAVAGLVLGGAAVAWLRPGATGSAVPGACATGGGELLLDARPQLMGYGGWYGFTVDRAGALRFTADLPEGVESALVWGPPAGQGPRGHLPDPALAERIPLRGPMTAPIERRARTLGPHVLLLEQVPVTMGDMSMPAHVRVEFVPDHPDCAK